MAQDFADKAIWPHFEFNYILNLYILSMCFVCYRNVIVCGMCNAMLTLFFRQKILRRFLAFPLAPQKHMFQYHLFLAESIQKIARSLWGYSQQPLCDHLPSNISEFLF